MYSPASSYASSPSSGGTPLKYKCEYCPQAFTFKFELASHERKDHTNHPEDEVMVVDEQEKINSESLDPKPDNNSGVQTPSQDEMDQSYVGYSENEESNTSSTKSRLRTLRRTNDRRSRDASQPNYNSDGKAEESSKSESESTSPPAANTTTTTITSPMKNIIKRERSYSIQDENVQSDLVITSVSSISSSTTNNNKSNNNDHDENSRDSQRPSLRLRPRPSLSLSTTSSTTSSSAVPHKMEEKSILNPTAQPKSHLRETNDKSQVSTTTTMTKPNKMTTMKKTIMKKSKANSNSSINPCPLCPKAFSTFWNMKRHVKNNHPTRTSHILRLQSVTSTAAYNRKSMETKNTREAAEEEEEEEEKPTMFPCGICSATFNKKSNRDVHERIHSGQKFKCAICQSEFSRPSTLIDHIKGRHMYKPPPTTTTTNVQRQQLQQQRNTSISTLHSQRPVSQNFRGSGERFLCQYPTCNSTFSRRDSMLEHFKLVHLGERRFTCPYTNCKRKFGRKDQLNSHMVSHLSLSNQMFRCDVCGKECKSEHYLRYHKKVHSKKVKSIVCPVSGCHRRFFTQSDVNKHSKFAHAPKISSSLFHTARIN